jgi:hypothetical protein
MDISKTVKELISYHSGIKLEKLSDSDFIEEDLGTTGDDAWELMEDLHNKLGVDLADFDFSLHFGPEAGSQTSKDYGYYPVSVSHLVKVTKEQKWIVPEKNEKYYERVQETRKKGFLTQAVIMVAIILVGRAWSYID